MLKMKLDLQFFASGTLTGNVKTSSSGTKLQMKLEWSSVENVSANTSTITTKLYGKRADSLSGATSGKNWGGKVQVGSNTAHSFSSVSSQISVSTSWVLFKTYTDTITHNPDGTKSVTITASLNGCGGTSLAGLTSSASGTATLGTIPRGSILGDIEDFNIDDTITILITKNVETYTDNLVISSGETTIKTINAIVNNAEVSFTEEEKNVIRSLMTSPKLELTFTLTTLNGSETLGSSIKIARVSSFDKPLAFNVRKKDNGHYQWAFNGLVDETNDNPLQVYDDDGNLVGGSSNEVVLYDNETGSSETITLSETSANFKYLEIFYKDNDGTFSSIKVYNPNSKQIDISTMARWSSTIYLKQRRAVISGTSISKGTYSEVSITATPKISIGTTTNVILITRVVGYRN